MRTDVLIPFINLKGNAFLDLWLTQMISAKSDAMAPPEESKTNWFIALAGNLLWAAACFIPGSGIVKALGGASQVLKVRPRAELPKPFPAGAGPGIRPELKRIDGNVKDPKLQVVTSPSSGMSGFGRVAYATMSVGGAYTGAGGMAFDATGAPTGKDVVAAALNEKRKQLGNEFKKMIGPYATELMQTANFANNYRANAVNTLEAIANGLWFHIFPSIPFEGRTEIYQSGLTAINGALQQFNMQYRTWRQQIERWAEHEATIGRGRGYQTINQDKYQERIRYYERSVNLGFKPKLSF
jgi:hypothetical protein